MKMASMGVKGIGSGIVLWLTYLTHTFSPLIWVLIALVFIDLFMNVHHEGKQFAKIGSMVMTLGVPSFIAQNLHTPGVDLPKYIVAMLCLVYLQIVVPQIVDKMNRFTFSKNKATDTITRAELDALLQGMADKGRQMAKAEQTAAEKAAAAAVESAAKAGTGGTEGRA